MIRIMVDSVTLTRMEGVSQPAEVCDTSGRIIGHFIPTSGSATLDPGVSEVELDRRQQARGGRSLGEILANLEKQA